MPSRFPAPGEHVLQSLLDRLTDTPMHVATLPTVAPQREPTGLIAEYVSDGDVAAAIAFFDHDAVNFVGGAIASVGADTLRGPSHKPALNDAAVNGLRDVADGIGAALNGAYTPAVHLADVHRLPGALSESIKQLWRDPAAKRAYRLTVDDYGAGTVILCLA